MKIYKYFKIKEESFENLKNGELFFNNPSNFDDINDSNLKIRENVLKTFINKSIQYLDSIPSEKLQKLKPPKGFYEKLNTKSSSDDFLELFNEFKNYFIGITCFSESNDIQRMWDDYASENRGFCICFETNLDYPFFNGLTKVNYVEKLPTIDLTSENFEKGFEEFYTTKDEEIYDFEEEQRLVKKNQGLLKYDKNCVEEIIIGNKMSKIDKSKIITIIKEYYSDNVFITQN